MLLRSANSGHGPLSSHANSLAQSRPTLQGYTGEIARQHRQVALQYSRVLKVTFDRNKHILTVRLPHGVKYPTHIMSLVGSPTYTVVFFYVFIDHFK